MTRTDVVALEAREWPLIGDVIAEAFADDPVNLWAFNGVAAMRPSFRAMARYLYLVRGFGHRTADGRAGTLWLPPGAAKSHGLRGTLALARALTWHGGLRAVRNGLAIDAFMNRKRPREPHYYLFAIAVAPELQGKGRGGLLMREALRRVDGEGMPAYLESSRARNLPFYRQFGFEVVEEAAPARGCPPVWRMWRPAQAAP
ncbi:MAG: GNAT family N-acetyltransferase [Gammaproteobacteria bacterium]|nr:GNAT family N-acetyltransferase [Gammaproteobacteria bacterium]